MVSAAVTGAPFDQLNLRPLARWPVMCSDWPLQRWPDGTPTLSFGRNTRESRTHAASELGNHKMQLKCNRRYNFVEASNKDFQFSSTIKKLYSTSVFWLHFWWANLRAAVLAKYLNILTTLIMDGDADRPASWDHKDNEWRMKAWENSEERIANQKDGLKEGSQVK